MFKQIEAPVSEWTRSTRAQQLKGEISRLERIQSLIPAEEDFLKYSLTVKEVHAIFPSIHRFNDESRINRWRNAMNGIIVILRKRDAENPEMKISWSELREAINILINDEPFGDVALFVINVLERQGLIDTNDWRYVNIVKPKAEIEGVVSVPF